ncbi:hypothetical protein C7H62_2708 [Mesoflavibacter sp. HG96]|uniref:T9SS type A sorting domain-containing protein n=1 Tax=unclassified Mesoflavibacter TaxID=2630131 RepID=UPI000D11314A|nr:MULTISPECIES: T9SS type A sorting domain-containing protein [unclassified Mesoflavibacter]QIJ90516.1 hypothetical protein C7H62_2708 [Mesoflavibacter sp. HG96]QIJ93244.1 hypothetical protein C7H56_2708 [Mesoflavibacter sp. HG37]
MKKITFLFMLFALAFTWQINAQHTFPVIAGPTNVAAGSPVTLSINDAANSATVPAGSYSSFTVTADWTAGGGGPWSSEADITLGGVSVDPPTSGGATSGNATTLTFDGSFSALYDPTIDGTLDLVMNQSYGGSDADWSNITVTIFPAPATVPECTTNEMSTPDASCGNYDTTISWDALAGVDGYLLTVGTTSGGNDILDNSDIGDVTSYVLSNQTAGTTYYWTVSPYNAVGPAVGCTENMYTTNVAQCYCESIPSSNDGTGIGNLQVGTTDFASAGDITYEDFTGTPVDLGQGITANVVITFMTNYTYDTHIWIDLNDDYVFDDATELLYSGESPDSNTGTDILDASFMMPATAALGQHRMRIGTADTGQATPDSCYNGSWGVTMDVDVNIIAVSCTAPTATTSLVTDCGNSQFYVDVDVTGLGDGTSQINDGTNTYPATSLGVVQVGPYADGTSVTLVLENGTDSTCDAALGTFTYTCPIPGQLCETAIDVAALPYNTTDDTVNYFDDYTSANVACSTSSYLGGDDVVYAYTPSTDETVNISLSNTGTWVGLFVFTGCEAAPDVFTGCVAEDTQNGGNPSLQGVSLTGGTTYYVVISTWPAPQNTAYTLDITEALPNDECAGAFPLTLGVEMSGDNTGATDSGVTSACDSGIISDVWYSFVGPASTEVSIICSAANFSVFSDCTTELVCNQQTVTGLVDGQTYYVRVTDDGTARMQAPGAFTLTVSEVALSTAQFDQELGFSYYPNPVNNNLTLKSQKEINNVSVFNMIGQEVYRNVPNTMTEVVDMTNLQAGAYFVKVTIGNSTNTIKVIKN